MALSIVVMWAAAAIIALNWLSLIAYIVTRHKGNFSFAPPFLCGIAGVIASAMSNEPYGFAISAAFLLFDPSIGLALGTIAFKKCRGPQSNENAEKAD